jgi:carboxypeptidase C (cathepsin A)
MMRLSRGAALGACILCLLLIVNAAAQQPRPPAQRVQKTSPSEQVTPPQTPTEQPPQQEQQRLPEERPSTPAQPPTEQPQPEVPGFRSPESLRPMHFDMHEVPPVQTHHTINIAGKTLHYTATAGRLPIKDMEGNVDAEMFFVAYTLDGANPATRPLTFAYNGGPGSASIWLHMGALGPRKVVLQPEGWMPASPYRVTDNPNTPLDRTDLVLVDAIGTGYSRPADTTQARRFWSVNGDIQAFGEFIRMYISRYERWASPLYLFGESYGTTRSAGLAGYLADRGIAFNGIVLLSTVLNFESLEFARTNDVPYPLILPSYTMIAAYHKKLAPELMQDLNRTRAEVEQWAMGEYAQALDKGDALTPEQRQNIIDKLSRYTGLSKEVVDWANLRIDVRTFTHYLLADQKLRVGRLDGRYTGPDPNGFLETQFYDPAGAQTGPPFTMVFNNYVRNELNYKVDMPYYVSATQSGNFAWNWTTTGFGSAYTDTATPLRQAMVKDAFLKVLVMEGYYDLATPYFAANYTMDHLDLSAPYRKNISYATYDSGHMVYLDTKSHAKMKQDFEKFLDDTAGSAH